MSDNSPDDLFNDGQGGITRRRFLEKSAKFLAYTSPTLTTLLVADRAVAVSVAPYFEVEAEVSSGGQFAGMPATGVPNAGATREWEMQPNILGPFALVLYQKYRIRILGSGQFMPTGPVSVTVSWALSTDNSGDGFEWGPAPQTGTQTVNVPPGGGTLGTGGTIVDSGGAPWPAILVTLPYTGVVGTVTFTANPPWTNIGRLTLNIVLR